MLATAEASGHVTINERNPTDKFQRFVDEKIRHWLKKNDFQDGPIEYEVAFFDEDVLGEVSCMIVVQNGARMWRSWETAENPRMALSKSMEHLQNDPTH